MGCPILKPSHGGTSLQVKVLTTRIMEARGFLTSPNESTLTSEVIPAGGPDDFSLASGQPNERGAVLGSWGHSGTKSKRHDSNMIVTPGDHHLIPGIYESVVSHFQPSWTYGMMERENRGS